MTLDKFLLTETSVWELCKIYEDGRTVACAWIDNEDLFIHSIPARLLSKTVKDELWGIIHCADVDRSVHDVRCHCVYA